MPNAAEIALKPCPFCGHDWPLLITHSSEATTDYSVKCYQGCCETASDELRSEAIATWNTRNLLEGSST